MGWDTELPCGAETSQNDYYNSYKEFSSQNVYIRQVYNAYFPQ